MPADAPQSAYVVYPDVSADADLDSVAFPAVPEHQQLQLFHAGTTLGTTEVSSLANDSTPPCPSWPRVQIGAESGVPWSVGFAPDRIEPFPQDSLSGLSASDSLRVVIDVARLASALPGDTASAFLGRPFVVRQVVRADVGVSRVLIAEVVRTVNQEATPLQEHVLLVAERPSDSGTWTTAFSERAIGLEDTNETTDVLARFKVAARPAAVFLLLSRDFGESGAFALLERAAKGSWHVRWVSPFAGC